MRTFARPPRLSLTGATFAHYESLVKQMAGNATLPARATNEIAFYIMKTEIDAKLAQSESKLSLAAIQSESKLALAAVEALSDKKLALFQAQVEADKIIARHENKFSNFIARSKQVLASVSQRCIAYHYKF
jgi:hypothetical protein